MEAIAGQLVEQILDPVVIVPALTINAVLISGLAGRLADAWQDRPLCRRRRPADG